METVDFDSCLGGNVGVDAAGVGRTLFVGGADPVFKAVVCGRGRGAASALVVDITEAFAEDGWEDADLYLLRIDEKLD